MQGQHYSTLSALSQKWLLSTQWKTASQGPRNKGNESKPKRTNRISATAACGAACDLAARPDAHGCVQAIPPFEQAKPLQDMACTDEVAQTKRWSQQKTGQLHAAFWVSGHKRDKAEYDQMGLQSKNISTALYQKPPRSPRFGRLLGPRLLLAQLFAALLRGLQAAEPSDPRIPRRALREAVLGACPPPL